MALRKNSREGRSGAPTSRSTSKRSEGKFNKDKSTNVEARHKREGEENREGKFRKPGKFAKPTYPKDTRFERPKTESRDGENTRNTRNDKTKRPGKFSKPGGVNWDDRKKTDKKTPYTKHTRHDKNKLEDTRAERPKFTKENKFTKEEKFSRPRSGNFEDKKRIDDRKPFEKYPKPEATNREKFGEESTEKNIPKFAAKRAVNKVKPRNSRESNFAKTGRFGKPKTEGSSEEKAEKREPREYRPEPKTYKQREERNSSEKTERKAPREYKTESKTYKTKEGFKKKDHKESEPQRAEMRLNRFLANGGISSRRDADLAIEKGYVEVNGKTVTELGTKVQPNDTVTYKGKKIYGEKKMYFVLNKPRDTISTMHDPEGRKTVMDIMSEACEERIFPVGRLDRNTTGILIFTNDGELSQKLTHPSFAVKKIYEAGLDKPMTQADLQQLADGIVLEDGDIQADNIGYNDETKKSILIEIHSGKNHIIHRMFEHLGYKVEVLDRVYYAGITKKGIKRGQFKEINAKDLNLLRKSCGIKPSKF